MITISSVRVLLVEDGQNNRELISLVLEEMGADITCAENGQEGLDAVRVGQFDVILMDMQMPVMDGYTATRHLRDLGCTLPIIALTAHAMRGDKEKCLAAGCSHYLMKPIHLDQLLQTVANAVGCEADELSSIAAETWDTDTGSDTTESGSEIISTLLNDVPQFRSIVEAYIDQLPATINKLQKATDDADFEELAKLAHSLLGTGGTMGFDCLTEPAFRLEQAAKQRRAEDIDNCIRAIDELVNRIVPPVPVSN